jgi:two-component system, NarL family, nitrate/nitrite response regulator NarL
MRAGTPGATLADVPLRCLIVDDNARFLAAARALLEREGLHVVGVATCSAEALEHVRELRPEVVLVDIELGEESGLELTRGLAEAHSGSIILTSTHSEADFAELIAASAATGFIAKSELSADAVRALV